MHIAENTLSKIAAGSRCSKTLGFLALAVCGLNVGVANAASPSPGSLHKLNLGWNPVPEPGVQGYNIYLGTRSGEYKPLARNVKQLNHVIDSLEYGKTYYVRVRAVGSSGLEGAPSEEMKIAVATPPLPRAGRIELSKSKKPGFKWSFPKAAISTAPEFLVFESSDMLTWTQVGTVQANQAVAQDSQNLEFEWPVNTTGPQKFYRLTAANWVGTSTEP
jgi:hypothetical protein